jgi:hypothetical protein
MDNGVEDLRDIVQLLCIRLCFQCVGADMYLTEEGNVFGWDVIKVLSKASRRV